MRRFGALSVLGGALVVLSTAPAAAQTVAPPPVSLELPPGLSLPPLYPNERLRLSFPIRPLRFSFSEVRPIGLGAFRGPTDHFVAESVWLDAGPLSVRTRMESVEAVGLDCTGLTCAPATERSVSVEARLDLGALAGSTVVPQTYLFSRYKVLPNPSGGFTRPRVNHLQLGWGGLLDL